MPTPAASSAFGYGTSPPLHQRGANDALRPYGGPASGGWLGWWTVTRLANGIAGLSGWRRWLTAALLGMCATAALPPVHALPLLIVAFTGLVWLLDGARSHRAAFGIGWWFGIGFFLTGLYWVSIAFLVDAATFGWMIPFALFGLSAGLGLFTGAATLLARASGARGVGRVLALAVAWTALEWLRGVIFTGFPWNLVGYAWSASEAVSQAASVTGIYGLSLVTVAVAAMPAVLADDVGLGSAWRRWTPVATAAVLLAGIWCLGALRLAGADGAVVPDVRLRIVQPGVEQDLKWLEELREAHFQRHLALTGSPGIEGITHVVWPESAVPFAIAHDLPRRMAIAAALPPDAVLLTGAPRTPSDPAAPFEVWNSLHAIDAAGGIVGTYDKFHLVPFGEYVPFREVLSVAKLTHGDIDFSAGPGPQTMAVPGAPAVSPLICYEAIFPGNVVARSGNPADRPGWLLNVTNDGWFGISSGPYQHFASARMRAVEEGLPMVRAANTGISAVVDPYGRITAYLGLGRTGVIDADLPTALAEPTVFARFGNWTALLLLIATAILAWATSRETPRDLSRPS